MIAHVTAAALASENKSLAHPASVDSLPTSANQEDFVSMATFAARRLTQMNANTAHILAHRTSGRGRGHRIPAPAEELGRRWRPRHAAIRAQVPRFDQDRFFAPSIAAARETGRGPRLRRPAAAMLRCHRCLSLRRD